MTDQESQEQHSPTEPEDVKKDEGVEMVEVLSPPVSVAADLHFTDHFSLTTPSNAIRSRANATSRVYENAHTQIILDEVIDDETGKRHMTLKKIGDSSARLKFLRACYSIVTVFWSGFLAVFCLMMILFLVLDLTIQIGATSIQEANNANFLGVLLSVPVMVLGMAEALVIATHFVADTWGGHTLIRNFMLGKFHVVVAEWFSFVLYLGLPILVMCFALITKSDTWWETTSLTWFGCMCGLYVVFSVAVVFYEVSSCLTIMKNFSGDDCDKPISLLKRSILLRQQQTYSGKRLSTRMALGALSARGKTWDEAVNVRESISIYSRFTCWIAGLRCFELFKKLEGDGKRIYTLNEVRDNNAYVTRTSWSLEKLFCRTGNSKFVAVINGKAMLTPNQLRSSFACAILGNILIIFLVVSLLVWMGAGTSGVLFAIAASAIIIYPQMKSTFRIYGMAKTYNEAKGLGGKKNGESVGMYEVTDTYRITELNECTCWILFAIEIGFFFLWPLIALFAVDNTSIGFLFFVVGVFVGLRHYFDPSLALIEHGSIKLVDEKTFPKDEEGDYERANWQAESRLNEVVGKITRSSGMYLWIAIFGTFVFVFCFLFFAALRFGNDTASSTERQFVPDFSYDGAEALPYPTCRVGSNFGTGNSDTVQMIDYAFMAGLAYSSTDITQGELNGWFGPGGGVIPTDQKEIVDEFRLRTDNYSSAVVFKLFTFEEEDGTDAIVAIRGTTNGWDALADAQLWGAAALMQGLRLVLPLGGIWTPIMDYLIDAISSLQSHSIDKVSFYKITSDFVNELKDSGNYRNVQVTGHSLGGGLSIITGARTNTPAVALSGPNALISHKTFPGVTVEALNTLTFNIIPDRDIVPRLDDVARLYQKIECTAPLNDVAGCHSSTRSLCELLYQCGNGPIGSQFRRPVMCDCVTVFGYEEPTQTTGMSFAEACAQYE
eukprot:CAMPEP_0116028594 /NCGR_PEP_ID=MMETSP0321-20121206/15519_1 /TAXON_ID=163516 /ORGANISM="Leptocylindrus danicus var. danicus, Strain B650" /LENGTH=946 /DNA_ID=CAMNT_0003502573 /DNA_START=63 /DNA_END=2906 /DNA_ORIENTATION=-